MFIFARITAIISSVTRFVSSPFIQARSAITNLRRNNPMSTTARQFQTMRGQMRSSMRLPQQMLSGLGIPMQDPRELQRDSKREKKRERKREDLQQIEEVGGSVEKYHQRRMQMTRNKRRGSQRMMQYQQIHLVNSTTGERHIAHLGMESASSTAEIVMHDVRLSVVQLAGRDSLPTLLISASPSAALQVDGLSEGQPLQLQPHSRISVRDVPYSIELLASDDRSAVTPVNAAWETSTGPVRQDNQDAIGIYRHPGMTLFAVADGVGGGYAGDRMSAFAVQYLLKSAEYNLHRKPNWVEIMQRAIQNANLEIRHYMQNVPRQAGTTLTAVVIEQWVATVGHVGDSRLYLLRRGRLQQVTQDHARTITIDEEQGVRTRTVLSRAIGRDDAIVADTLQLPLLPGDRLLLCTDGVSNRLPAEEIQRTLLQQTISQAARSLVELANARRNTDNATAVVIDILGQETQREPWQEHAAPRVFVSNQGHAPSIDGLQDAEGRSGARTLGRWLLLLLLIAAIAIGVWYAATRTAQPDNLSVQPVSSATQASTIPSTQTPVATEIRNSPTAQPTVTLRAPATDQPTQMLPALVPTQTLSASVILPTSTLRVRNQ
jgi:protein phosphatase